jgi:acetolactate synthase-1/3 small subunit
MSTIPALHTISLLVRNKPGVLVRVALVFARRGYNIESLVVSPASLDGNETGVFSRMTVTCSGDGAILSQMIRQIQRLIDVVHAVDHTNDEAIKVEIALAKVKVTEATRTGILQIAEHFHAKIMDFGRQSMVLRLYGSSEKIDAALDLLAPYSLTEVVRSGRILMTRGLSET